MDLNHGYNITCSALNDVAALRQEWLKLEGQADNSFFLSWHWLGAWLKTYRPDVEVLRAYSGDELVALALMVRTAETRFGILRSTVLRLHQTGKAEQDQIWIEYNGILTHPDHHHQVTGACLEFLTGSATAWDELMIGAVGEDDATLMTVASRLRRNDLWNAPCFGVDLRTIRDSGEQYIATLSRNTRYQIRRSLRKYEMVGEVSVDVADSVEQTIRFFDAAGQLHKQRWGTLPGQSGFANKEFVRFHHELIATGWPSRSVEICRLLVNSNPVAYFYNFIYRNRVYFYLSGIKFNRDQSIKPGLLGHALCIQRYLEQGRDFYDFMGGGERYKASLGRQHAHLYKMVLQKNLYKLKLELVGRRVKQSLQSLIGN